jgi:heptosyltransferase-1
LSVINIGAGEVPLAAAVIAAAVDSDPLVLSPNLPELAAVLLYSRLVIGADTGPLHLAAALGKRVLALFGPTNPERNGPLPKGIVLQNSLPETIEHERGNYEHRDEYSASMLSITVEQVLQTAFQSVVRDAEGDRASGSRN